MSNLDEGTYMMNLHHSLSSHVTPLHQPNNWAIKRSTSFRDGQLITYNGKNGEGHLYKFPKVKNGEGHFTNFLNC